MAAGFTRRFTVEVGDDVLLEIEGVDVLDFTGPTSLTGVGYGLAIAVGETEKGPFNEPTEITNAAQFLATFGGLGFTYAGLQSTGPVAERNGNTFAAPDAAELWNGNLFVQLAGKRFKRLVVVRADTTGVDGGGTASVARFTRITNGRFTGLNAAPFNMRFLAAPRTLITTSDLAGPTTVTMTAGPATRAGGAFNAGNTLNTRTFQVRVNAGPLQTVTFAGADPIAIADAVAQINAQLVGVQAVENVGAIDLISDREGTSAQIIVSAGGGGADALGAAQSGITAGTSNGSGNVADAEAVTVAEIKTAFAAVEAAQGITIEAGASTLNVSRNAPGVGFSVTIGAGTLNTIAGWTPGVYAGAAGGGIAGVIPAGTRVRDAADTSRWATAEDIDVDTTSGPFDAQVRPIPDDESQPNLLLGVLDTIVDAPDASLGTFSVTNPAALNKRTSAQIVNAYQDALDATLDINTVAREASIIYSARTSTTIRSALLQNAVDASANGLFGRTAFIRPVLGTNPGTGANQARDANAATNSVGATRGDRAVYCYPSVRVRVKEIAARGASAGVGFTDDGVVNVGWDGFVASLRSQLAPEENPGQDTAFLPFVLGLETGNASIVGMTIADYINFRAAGIAAPRVDRGAVVLQSGVTSVDPAVFPALRNIARRSMSDFIQDTLSIRAQAYVKKLNSPARRAALLGEIDRFLDSLLAPNNPDRQRIADYGIKDDTTAAQLALGIFRVNIFVQLLGSMDKIVLSTTIGETVDVREAA